MQAISRLLVRACLYKPDTLKDDLKKRKQQSLEITEKYPTPEGANITQVLTLT